MGLEIYDDPYCKEDCFECGQKEVQIDNVKYWLESVVDHLYSTETVYLDDFEKCLEELCRSVKMKLPEKELHTPNIKPKIHPQNRDFEINWWKVWNHEQLKKISNS